MASASETSESQLSSNTKTTNSKAQSSSESSSESQKMRAAARSKLMEEAKSIGEDLKALQPEFDNMSDLFPINTWKDNKVVFAKWRVLFADLHNCTRWLPESRSDMNRRLQNPPGLNGMFQVILRMIFLTQFYSNGHFQRTLREIHNASQAAAE